jgi:hypothetical protein
LFNAQPEAGNLLGKNASRIPFGRFPPLVTEVIGPELLADLRQ